MTQLERRSNAARKAARSRKTMRLTLPHRLTRRQATMFNYISQFIACRGRSPSTAEIQTAFGYSSPSYVNSTINHLVASGYLLRRVIQTYTEITVTETPLSDPRETALVGA